MARGAEVKSGTHGLALWLRAEIETGWQVVQAAASSLCSVGKLPALL